MGELWRSIGHMSGAKIYSLVLGLISLSITARWLGPEGRGTVAAVMTWVGLFSTIAYLSLGQVALHHAAKEKGKAWLGQTFGSLLLVAIVMTMLSWIVASACYAFTEGGLFGRVPVLTLVLGFAALPFMIWEQYGSSLLVAMDKLSIYNRAQIVGKTASFVLIFILILWLTWGVNGALLAALIGQLITAIAGTSVLLSLAETKVRPEKETLKKLLSGGSKLHFNAVGAFLFTSTDILIIQHYSGAEQTGLYQFAMQLIGIMLIIPQSASMVLYSKITKYGPDAAWKFNKHVLVVLTLGMAGVAVVAAILAPYLIPLVAGQKFMPSVHIFHLLLFVLLGQTVSIIMASQWIGRGLFWHASAITLIVGILNVGANFLLIPSYGMYGAAWAAIGTYALTMAINLGMAVWVNQRVKSNAA